ncbi:MAG TPA: hypothetical protein VFU80_04355 [Sphingomicrobium sp.]|nr:hypothetical protein [Sphingomicrobium sp.]
MDRRQGRSRVLIAAALLLLCGAAEPRTLPIREARWLQTNDIVRDLSSLPPECIVLPASAAERRSVEVGRALFRSPLLLGGQAARAGLSCASCHRNGRTNPHFHFPGISGAPGTADVTASLMSKKRGDGTFNPKPIPDLAGDPEKLKVSRDPASRDLERFIHGLIVEEFDGPEPSPTALDSISAYVRAASHDACKGTAPVNLSLASLLADVESAISLARQSYSEGDAPTGRALLAAARSMLGTIDERFQLPGLERSRAALRAADQELFRVQDAGGADGWREWARSWPGRKRTLLSTESRSLFSEVVLRRSIEDDGR